MKQRKRRRALFSAAPVQYRDSPIAGRGVFARRSFEPGEVIAPYAPKQQRHAADDPAARDAASTKLTLLSEGRWVIVPDTRVPGGWLCNHSCRPNAALYSSGEGRVQCLRPIRPGQEVTIFYGWVTENEPGRDPCLCGDDACRGFINFDLSDAEVRALEVPGPEGDAARQRLAEYAAYLSSIDQDQVLDSIERVLDRIQARLALRP